MYTHVYIGVRQRLHALRADGLAGLASCMIIISSSSSSIVITSIIIITSVIIFLKKRRNILMPVAAPQTPRFQPPQPDPRTRPPRWVFVLVPQQKITNEYIYTCMYVYTHIYIYIYMPHQRASEGPREERK